MNDLGQRIKMKLSNEVKTMLRGMVLALADLSGDGEEIPLFVNPKYKGLILFKKNVHLSAHGRELAEYCIKYLRCKYRVQERVIMFPSGGTILLFNVNREQMGLYGHDFNRIFNIDLIDNDGVYHHLMRNAVREGK